MSQRHFEVQEFVLVPDPVYLDGDNLAWTVTFSDKGYSFLHVIDNADGSTTVSIDYEDCDVEGCLKEFVVLADAGPEEVLAFAKRRGVLGIVPTITKVPGEGPRIWQLTYTEPVYVYRLLALQAKSLLAVMEGLREGRQIKEADIENCFPDPLYTNINKKDAFLEKERFESFGNISSFDLYRDLTKAAADWFHIASCEFQWYPAENVSHISTFFSIEFGKWEDGWHWDQQRIRKSMRGFNEDYAPLPSSFQRPSPLFNILAFQLVEALSLPEGTYFCSQCQKTFQHEADKGNKPRRDKSVRFCGDDCRDEHKRAYDRQRYQKRRVGGQVEEAPAEEALAE